MNDDQIHFYEVCKELAKCKRELRECKRKLKERKPEREQQMPMPQSFTAGWELCTNTGKTLTDVDRKVDQLQSNIEQVSDERKVSVGKTYDALINHIADVDKKLMTKLHEMDREYDRQFEALKAENEKRLQAIAIVDGAVLGHSVKLDKLHRDGRSLYESVQSIDQMGNETHNKVVELSSRLDKVIEVGAQRQQRHQDFQGKISDNIQRCIDMLTKDNPHTNKSIRIALDAIERRMCTLEEQWSGFDRTGPEGVNATEAT